MRLSTIFPLQRRKPSKVSECLEIYLLPCQPCRSYRAEIVHPGLIGGGVPAAWVLHLYFSLGLDENRPCLSRTRQDYKYPLQADVGYSEQREGDCFRSWWDSLKGVEPMQIQQAKWSAGRRAGLWTLWDFAEVFRNRASPTWLEGWWEVFPQAWVWIWWTLKVFAAPWFCGQD